MLTYDYTHMIIYVILCESTLIYIFVRCCVTLVYLPVQSTYVIIVIPDFVVKILIR